MLFWCHIDTIDANLMQFLLSYDALLIFTKIYTQKNVNFFHYFLCDAIAPIDAIREVIILITFKRKCRKMKIFLKQNQICFP
jgi:hypothetical protein